LRGGISKKILLLA